MVSRETKVLLVLQVFLVEEEFRMINHIKSLTEDH